MLHIPPDCYIKCFCLKFQGCRKRFHIASATLSDATSKRVRQPSSFKSLKKVPVQEIEILKVNGNVKATSVLSDCFKHDQVLTNKYR